MEGKGAEVSSFQMVMGAPIALVEDVGQRQHAQPAQWTECCRGG